MIRALLCIIIAMAYLLFRQPTPDAQPDAQTVGALKVLARKMTAAERAGMADAYETLGRSIAADPAEDPVFVDTAAVRRSHRAAMLVVWRGVFDNEPGKYPDLREAVEGEVERALGLADVPLNPALQQQVAKTFTSISASFR